MPNTWLTKKNLIFRIVNIETNLLRNVGPLPRIRAESLLCNRSIEDWQIMTAYPILIIRNRDSEGRKFRPSDWADRMASSAATFESGRLKYDARVMPCKRCDDLICLRVDKRIADEHPHIMQTVSDFMTMHKLEDHAPKCPEHQSAFEELLNNTGEFSKKPNQTLISSAA